MNLEKWNALLEVQLEAGHYHPALGEIYARDFTERVKPCRLLRIGWGEGATELNLLEKAGFHVSTISVQPWQNCIQMDMHNQRFAPSSFDAVYGVQSFEHAYAPWLLLMECWVTLRMGGAIYFVVPTPDLHHVATHPALLDDEQWANGLEFCGFTLKEAFTRRYSVDCRCEDDFGNWLGDTKHHDVTCITMYAEKQNPIHSESWKVLEQLERIRRQDTPVGTV